MRLSLRNSNRKTRSKIRRVKRRKRRRSENARKKSVSRSKEGYESNFNHKIPSI
jgi:hypothetical protein